MSKILLVEDDFALSMGISYSLKSEGYELREAGTLEAAKKIFEEEGWDLDLILLDVMLPDGTGFEFCEAIRKKGSQVPIIFLTAVSDEINIVKGLDMGADDYITKPFRVKELEARIKANIRRNVKDKGTAVSCYQVKDLWIDSNRCTVKKGGEEIFLTPSEYRLLLELVTHPNQTLSRTQLMERLWDVDQAFVDDNTLSVYIKRLREKIEDDSKNPEMIVTVRGLGYQLVLKE
ncbi:MAG: response regulator transcription factor [Lachnospiraceae bacterium]|nr:response regulator transcription factor [Lachnospiraceae bacterium]